MSPQEVHQLSLDPITAHAYSPDRSQVVVCKNDISASIYNISSNGFELADTLSEHDKLITSIDWAPQTNRIVTCSQDRNAYVWTLTPETGKWKPTLVLLRLNRAATCVRWSPLENKFAVASGARAVAVCSFDEENDWWVAKHLKKPIRSTVLGLDWHPGNVLLAAGGADGKARVFSAWIKDVEKRPAGTIWGSKLPFNAVLGEYGSPSGGWVHGVSFSPSGDALAFTAHDSSITVVYPSAPDEPPAAVYTIRSPGLPCVSVLWTSESQFLAAGHDCQPFIFTGSAESGWSAAGSLDGGAGSTIKKAVSTVTGRLNSEAFNTFRQADSRGASSTAQKEESSDLPTVHQNTITSVRFFDEGKVSTSGADGRVVVWNVQDGLVGKLGRMGI